MKPNLTDPGKVVITIATTGGLHGKEANPALPEQPHEIVSDFHDCYNAGAAVAHMHVRDPDGRTCSDLGIYHEVVYGVMDRCPGMITQVGNGIGIWFDDAGVGQPFTEEVRMALLDIAPHPDMLTVNAGTFHFDHKGQEWLFANSKQWNSEFIEGCNYRGITNEIEVYDLSHIANVLELAEKGVLKAPMHFSFVMGIRGGIPATPANLLAMLDATPEGSSWQIVSIGRPPIAAQHHGGGHGRQYPRRHGGQRLLPARRAGQEQRPIGGTRRTHRARAGTRGGDTRGSPRNAAHAALAAGAAQGLTGRPRPACPPWPIRFST